MARYNVNELNQKIVEFNKKYSVQFKLICHLTKNGYVQIVDNISNPRIDIKGNPTKAYEMFEAFEKGIEFGFQLNNG